MWRCEDAMRMRRCKMQRSEMWRCSGRCDNQRHKMLQLRSICTLGLLHKNTFTHNLFCIQMLFLRHKHTTVHTQTLLHICAHPTFTFHDFNAQINTQLCADTPRFLDTSIFLHPNTWSLNFLAATAFNQGFLRIWRNLTICNCLETSQYPLTSSSSETCSKLAEGPIKETKRVELEDL